MFGDCDEYHSEYQSLEVKRHTQLTDKEVLHFFELPKLPKGIEKNDLLLLWLALFNANTAEDLKEIEALEVPEMKQAISAYHSVTASPEFRELERLRVKAQHDEAQALHNAERKEREKWQSVVAEKDAALADKDTALAVQNAALADKDAALAEQNATLANKDAALAEQNAALADKDAALAEQNATLADKDAERERLRTMLKNMNL